MYVWISILCFAVVILAVIMETMGVIKNIKWFIFIAPLFLTIATMVMLQIIYLHARIPVPNELLSKMGYFTERFWHILIGALSALETVLIMFLSLIDACGWIKRRPQQEELASYGDTKEFDLEEIFKE